MFGMEDIGSGCLDARLLVWKSEEVDAQYGKQRKWMLPIQVIESGCLVWMTKEVDAKNRRPRKWMLGNWYGRMRKLEDRESGCSV